MRPKRPWLTWFQSLPLGFLVRLLFSLPCWSSIGGWPCCLSWLFPSWRWPICGWLSIAKQTIKILWSRPKNSMIQRWNTSMGLKSSRFLARKNFLTISLSRLLEKEQTALLSGCASSIWRWALWLLFCHQACSFFCRLAVISIFKVAWLPAISFWWLFFRSVFWLHWF